MDDMDSATVNEKAIPMLDEATRAIFPYDNLDEIFDVAPVWASHLEDQGDGIVTYNGWLEGMGTGSSRLTMETPVSAAIVVDRIVKRFGQTTALADIAAGRAGDLCLPARPQRLRQDHLVLASSQLRAGR